MVLVALELCILFELGLVEFGSWIGFGLVWELDWKKFGVVCSWLCVLVGMECRCVGVVGILVVSAGFGLENSLSS